MDLIDRIQSSDAKAAAKAVIEGLAGAGYEMRQPRRGHVKSANFWCGRTYAFSFSPNQNDILFYCRNPGVAQRPGIAMMARQHHPGEVNTDRFGRPAENAKHETKIRLRTRSDADLLLKWLLPEARLVSG